MINATGECYVCGREAPLTRVERIPYCRSCAPAVEVAVAAPRPTPPLQAVPIKSCTAERPDYGSTSVWCRGDCPVHLCTSSMDCTC